MDQYLVRTFLVLPVFVVKFLVLLFLGFQIVVVQFLVLLLLCHSWQFPVVLGVGGEVCLP